MPTSKTKKDRLISKTTRLTRRAWLWLLWERYAPVFALAALIVGLFLTASFGGVWERIGDPWRAIALIVSAYFLIKAALKARNVRRPRQSDARRRVETDSGISHRPIDTLHDAPALSEDLWPAHYKAARTSVGRLRPAKLRPALSPIDPYFLRFALPCVLGLGLMVGYGDNAERLRRAFSPTWTSGINPADITYDAWVDPPEYTGRPPIYFKGNKLAAIPAGSELVARISGANTPPRLKLRMDGRSRYLGLSRLGPKSFEARTILTDTARASWRIGSKTQDWKLTVIQDSSPVVSFFETPKADKRDRLGFIYDFKDDYGVETLELELKLITDAPEEAALSERVQVTLPSRSVREADRASAQLDLTRHMWAGRKVTGQLIATDGLGQQAKSETAFFTVPDKIFIEPLAKAIAEQRSLVMAGTAEYGPPVPLKRREWRNQPYFDTFEPRQRLDRAPATVQRAALLIDAITIEPDDIYKDPAVYIGLKNVLGRMRYAREQADLSGIPEDLWSIALRAEFGLLGTALEEMREAEQALSDAMARGAPQREIDTLFDRYNEAVDRYTEYLRLKAIEEGEVAENEGGGEGGGKNIDEIQALLDAIEEANRIGDTEGARKALKQLAELLENMKVQLAKGGGGGGEGEMSEEMKKALEELADLLGEQRELKDETEEAESQSGEGDGSESGSESGSQSGQSGDGQSGESGSGGNEGPEPLTPRELAERQGALEDMVAALRDELPEEGTQPGGSGDQPGEGGSPGEDGEQPGGGAGEEDGEGAGSGGEEGETGSGGGGTQESPDAALGRAGSAMADSRRRLGTGDLEGAAQAQAEAIDALREAGRGLANAAGKGRNENQDANADPLGRGPEGGGSLDTETDADIDTRDNATKARDLMEELRRRAAEQERDQSERDYLERLMKRF